MRIVRGIVVALMVVLALPYVLTPLCLVITPPSTLMIWRWATGQRVVQTYRPLSAIAPTLPRTVINAEDSRFCTHHGIDFDALQTVLDDTSDDGVSRGASTLTQQVAKNLFLWPGRSYVRKALELPLALWIDLVLSKRRIMEIYLNVAEWGPNGEFGAEAASQYAFHRPAARLTAHESAALAAILPNPHTRSAKKPGPAVRRLAGLYQRRAARSGPLDRCLHPKAG
jgi:monofunctional biosynthetic peptidoglycan transglycosylase